MADDLVEVELDDELDGPDRCPGGAPRTVRRPWTARAWCRVAAGLAVLVAAGAVQDAARAASVAELTARAVGDLRVERVARWTVEGSLVGVTGDVVLVAGTGDTLAGYRWLDGMLVWGVAGVTRCALVGLDDAAGTAASPTRDLPLERGRVVCAATRRTGPPGGLEVLDPADGRRLVARPAGGATTAWAADGERLYTVRDGEDGEPGEATAVSLTTGALAWRTPLTEPLSGWYLTDEWLVLQGQRRALALATGAEGEPQDWVGRERHALDGGGTAVSGWDPDGSLVTTTVADASGRHVWRRQAYYAAPALVLDSSVLPVITLAGTLAGLDAATGAQLWTGALPGPLVAAVDGVLVCAEAVGTRVAGVTGALTEWVGVDLRTGVVRWQFRSADGLDPGERDLVTDGERFAVGDPAGGVEVRDLRSGEVVGRWDTGVTDPSTLVPLADGRVVQVTAERVAVLWP